MAKPKEMKYAHKFHIVFMIFSFVFRFVVFFLFAPLLHLFWHSFFSALHFYWFPNGFWRFSCVYQHTHTRTSLGIGYGAEEVSKMELGKGVRCPGSSFSSQPQPQPQLVACVHRFVANAFH